MTHNRMSLASELAIYKQVRAEIAASFGLDEEDEAVRDTVEGETGLTDLLVDLMRIARREEAEAKGLGELIKQEQERKQRKEEKGRRLRAIVLNAMSDADLPKIAAPDFTASRSPGRPSVHVRDPDDVPDEMCRIKQIREPDKTKIGEALKRGEELPYACFGNAAQVLTVRSA